MSQQQQLISQLEEEHAMLGLEAPLEANSWSLAQISAFFDSDGDVVPDLAQTAPAAAAPAAATPAAAAPAEAVERFSTSHDQLDQAATSHQRPGGAAIEIGKKVIFTGPKSEATLNGQVGEVMPPAFDTNTPKARYTVKIMTSAKGRGVTGRAQNDTETLRRVLPANLILHPDQVQKDRQLAEDGALVLLGGDELSARAALYNQCLDPELLYDAAVDRVLSARHEFQVLDIAARWTGADLSIIKRAYRKISLAVHPDRNKHPQVLAVTFTQL